MDDVELALVLGVDREDFVGRVVRAGVAGGAVVAVVVRVDCEAAGFLPVADVVERPGLLAAGGAGGAVLVCVERAAFELSERALLMKPGTARNERERCLAVIVAYVSAEALRRRATRSAATPTSSASSG